MEGNRERLPSSSPRQSPLSPFPFGTPITFSGRSILSPGRRTSGEIPSSSRNPSPNMNHSSQSAMPHVIRGRIRAQDVYGGPLMFGGSSSLRRNRLLSASPYEGAAALRYNRPNRDTKPKPSNTPTPSTSKSTTPTSEDGMSSTAKVILDTLERMSTPVRDAQKIPLIPRAEKRRQVMSELESTLLQSGQAGLTPASKRRRPNLSSTNNFMDSRNSMSSSFTENRNLLNGPPLRTLMSPVAATARSRQPLKSARISSMQATPQPVRAKPAFVSSTPNPAFLETAESRQMANHCDKSNSPKFPQLSFSVPALSGGEPTIINSQAPFKSSGKIRTKLGETAKEMVDKEEEPLPPHLSRATGLELKGIPSFNLNFLKPQVTANSTVSSTTSDKPLQQQLPISTSKPDGTLSASSSTKTTDTVLLTPDRLQTSIPSFDFADPVQVSSGLNQGTFSDMNGTSSSYKFTFSLPVEVSRKMQPTDLPRSSSATTVLGGITSLPRSPIKPLPDLMGSSLNTKRCDMAAFPTAVTLKQGSVMDILGGSHKLPDVTASTGLKNFNLINSNDTGTSTWTESKMKFGNNHWA